MDGSEKLKLVVIGKFENPRCFKGVKSLPVTYRANKRVWMISKLFTKWVLRLDRRFNAENRKVLLLVDNCAAHPKLAGLKAITLAFFPPNTTSVLQPCDQGIIYNLNCKYRQRMVQHVIDCYDKKKDPAINVLLAIRYAFSAWEDVTPVLISKCFKKSGFSAPAFDESIDDDDDVPLAQLISDLQDNIPLARLRETTQIVVSADDLLASDLGLPCTEERTDDDIVVSISRNEPEMITSPVDDDDDYDDDDERSEEIPLVSKEEALASNAKIRSYFEASAHTEDSVFRSILEIEIALIHSEQKQTTILDFFDKQ